MSNVQAKHGVTSIGLVLDWSGSHAYNIFVYNDGSVKLFEPQDDRFIDPDSDDKYAFDNVDIII